MIIAAACAATSTWFFMPRKADLRAFEPAAMAKTEAGSWRHYYEKHWAALFADLYIGAREQYGFSPCDSCRLAIHAARAAKAFQASHNRAEAGKAIPELVRYFSVIRTAAGGALDVEQAAKLELEWWQLRRENKSWREYGSAVAAATAILYSLPPSALEPACLKRAEMMDVRDRKGKSITSDDWRQIEAGLREAWMLCKAAVARNRA